MTDPSLTEIAAELYSAPPNQFVSARDSRAKQVADRELAAEVKALRKPSIAAWVMNLFAAERSDRLGQALQLADELREAQDDLDASALSKLSRDRRALTAQLAREAASLASTSGERVTDSTVEAVHQTISAAFFDPAAAAAVASGRLVRELEPSNVVPLNLDSVVAGDIPERTATHSLPADEVRERRDKKDAEKAVHAAERDLDRAKRNQTQADNERDDAASRAARLAEKAEELEAELKKVRHDAKKALVEVNELAGRAAESAEHVAEAAQAVEATLAARGSH